MRGIIASLVLTFLLLSPMVFAQDSVDSSTIVKQGEISGKIKAAEAEIRNLKLQKQGVDAKCLNMVGEDLMISEFKKTKAYQRLRGQDIAVGALLAIIVVIFLGFIIFLME